MESIVTRLEDIKTERIQDKGEKIAYHKQDEKNITIHEEDVAPSLTGKNPEDMGEGVSVTKADRNERIYYVKEAGCPDNSPPDDIEVLLGDEKNDNNDILDDEKEASCPDDTTPDDMDVGNDDDKNDKNDKIYDEKEVASLDDTTPADMKIGAGDDKNGKDEKIYDEKEHTDDMGEGVNETKDDKNDKFDEE